MAVSLALNGFVPKVLAIDEKRNAMIQIGAQPIGVPSPKSVIEILADLHISSIERIEVLKAGGVPDRRLSWLSSNISDILRDPILDLCEHMEHITGLREHISDIQGFCERLSGYDIPDTLVHGDFNEGNICTGSEPGSTFSLINWANCCIGHPFFDLARLRSRRNGRRINVKS